MVRQEQKRPSLFWMIVVMMLLQAAFAGMAGSGDQPVIVKVGGTGGAYAGMKAVAQAFQKQEPQVHVVITPPLGSTGGIKAVLAGAIDVALSTRPLTLEEAQKGVVAQIYGRTPLVFATPYQRGAALAHFTLDDIAAIYTGTITTWPDGTPLRLVMRPKVEYDNILIKQMSPALTKAVSQAEVQPGMRLAVTDTDNANVLADQQFSFGSISLGQILGDKLPLYPLSLGGVAPSLETLKNGTYPYGKSFSLVTGPHPKAEVRKFVQFVFSPQGREILMQTGHLPEIHAHE